MVGSESSWLSLNTGGSHAPAFIETAMKIRNIKSEKELVGGQYYIRLTINSFGEKLIQIIKVLGAPFFEKQKIKIEHVCESKFIWNSYITDLGINQRYGRSVNAIPYSGSKLFRYNAKNLKFISGLTKLQSLSLINSNENQIELFNLNEIMRIQSMWGWNEYHRKIEKERERNAQYFEKRRIKSYY